MNYGKLVKDPMLTYCVCSYIDFKITIFLPNVVLEAEKVKNAS